MEPGHLPDREKRHRSIVRLRDMMYASLDVALVSGGRGPEELAEIEGHVALAREADRDGDLGDGSVTAQEELLGAVDPSPDHVAMRRDARAQFEGLAEMVSAHPGQRRQLGQAEIVAELRLDVIYDP